eukprot:COSAG01_NODE_317_length_18969_cov_378.101219_7_plen_44_part_00
MLRAEMAQIAAAMTDAANGKVPTTNWSDEPAAKVEEGLPPPQH